MNNGVQKNNAYHVQAQEKIHLVHFVDDARESEIVISFVLEKESELDYSLIIAGDTVPRAIDLKVELRGEYAQATINGAYSLWHQSQLKIVTHQIHAAAHTSSHLKMNGILCDQSRISYHGMIQVDACAQKTVASQENKTLLFSSDARAISVPSLQVLANKVSCAHGSAIGKLDEQLLALLQMRGMAYKKAQQLLVEGFFGDVVRDAACAAPHHDRRKTVHPEQTELCKVVSKDLLYPLKREEV
jgi:Fe-S cluster assembly protein SufD